MRIKAKDIFSHPWIRSFENKVPLEEFKLDLKANDEKKIIYNDNTKYSNASTNYSASNSSNRKNSRELDREILNKTINQQKENVIQEALASKNNEFSLINNQNDNLFDKVLSQVIKKNGIYFLN
jgi:hypothetical protein